AAQRGRDQISNRSSQRLDRHRRSVDRLQQRSGVYLRRAGKNLEANFKADVETRQDAARKTQRRINRSRLTNDRKEKHKMIATLEYEPHPLALLFPEQTAEEKRGLREHIRKFGLQAPCILFEGKVLDGRSRQEQC